MRTDWDYGSALLAISCGAAGTVVYRRKRRLTIKESQ